METSKKLESNLPRKSQTVEHKGDGDRSKLLQNSMTNRTQSTRSTSKPSVGSSQIKTVKQSSSSSTLKSSPHNASSSHLLTKKSTNSKTRSENAIKSSNDSTVKKRKSREQAGYSEKRGLSTVYMPKPIASKLNVKSNEKTVHQMSTNKEKLQDSSVSNQVKRQLSKERRKSRTLSPSEIRMLHSAVKRPEKVEQKEDAQADSDQADYDYEDDFEVKKEKEL